MTKTDPQNTGPAPAPTLSDVAHRARVSTATVSRCLNAPNRVVPGTRARVMRAIEELRYTPNFGGRALASRRTDTIGAVIPTMDNAIFAKGLQAFEETLTGAGLTLLVASTHYDPAREDAQVRSLASRGAEGLLLIGWSRAKAVNAFLRARHLPAVIAWAHRDDADMLCAGFDNRTAMRTMVAHVLARGHGRLAMIAGICRDNDRASERVEGAREALQNADLCPNQLRVVEAPYTIEAGRAAMGTLLDRVDRPTAVVCGNDVLAVGALMEAKHRGLRVPDDISIVGFDNLEMASVVDPQLTTVHVPHRRMGRAAAEILIAMLRGGEMPASQRFDTEIIERGSLGAPRPK